MKQRKDLVVPILVALNNPLLEDHQVAPKTPEDIDYNDEYSTTPTKFKNKRLTEK